MYAQARFAWCQPRRFDNPFCIDSRTLLAKDAIVLTLLISIAEARSKRRSWSAGMCISFGSRLALLQSSKRELKRLRSALMKPTNFLLGFVTARYLSFLGIFL